MTLKILGGKFSGRLLKAPKGTQTRPTTSMVRKAVFDILQPQIEGAVFLDLFSGSGAMGIEALSRGAQEAIFVDMHAYAIQALKENIALLSLQSQTTLFQIDVFKALAKMKQRGMECDIIFADPPYDTHLGIELINWLDVHPLLNPQGTLFVETASPSPFQKELKRWHHLHPLSPRKYGNTELYQFTFLP